MKNHTKTLLVAIAFAGLSATTVGAETITPSADTAGRNTSTNLDSSNATNLAVGPISGSSDFFRTYLSFDLSALTTGLTPAGGSTTITLRGTGFGAGENENNDLSLEQTYTLFALAADWDSSAAPGPNPGTVLATTTLTVSTGDDTQDLIFSSTDLTAAFNSALGGSLYLGILSDGETLAPGPQDRSFKWFGSSEDGGGSPTLDYTPVPEPTSLALLGVGGLCVIRRRRI